MLILLLSCEKQTEWKLDGNPGDLIIVEGIITDEQKIHVIKLSFPAGQLNEVSAPVTGAVVLISNEDSVLQLTENPSGSGIYVTDSLFIALINKHYTLQVHYNNNIFTAKASMIQGAFFSPLKYSKNTDDNLFHIDWVANAYNAEDAAMYEVDLDWSELPQYQSSDPDSCKAKLFYYTLPTLDVSEILAPGKQKISFPAGTIITERRYSLSPEHADFIRALLLETTWQGGFFDSEHANLPTNLSAGAVGFFGACSVTSLSLTVTE